MRGFTPEKASIVGQLPFGKALLEMQILKLMFPPVNYIFHKSSHMSLFVLKTLKKCTYSQFDFSFRITFKHDRTMGFRFLRGFPLGRS